MKCPEYLTQILIAIYVLICAICAVNGAVRKIGFLKSFICCLIFSPVVGLLIILLSGKNLHHLVKMRNSYNLGLIDEQEYYEEVDKYRNDSKITYWKWYVLVAALTLNAIYLLWKWF